MRYCAICKWHIYCLIVCVPGGLWCPENGVHVAASERGVGQWIVQREALSRHSINNSINQSINNHSINNQSINLYYIIWVLGSFWIHSLCFPPIYLTTCTFEF